MALCFPGVTWLLSTGALGLVVPSLPTVPSSITGPEASHPGSSPGRLEVGGEGCSLVTGNSIRSSYSRIRRASLLERWSWAGLGWAGLAGTSSQASLQGAHGSSTPSGGHTGKTGSVWRSPGRGSSPSPLTAQASQDHLPPETLSASELGCLRWSWNLCGPQFRSQLYREQVP